MRVLLLVSLLASACATAPVAPPSPAVSQADPVIAAERAFAADAARRGWAAAFRSYAAADAITLSPDPVNAHVQLAQIPGDGETTLDWRPAYAGVSRGGDFGFTTGPFLLRGREGIVGHYFTVWRRQQDGSWKWIFDAGTDVRARIRRASSTARKDSRRATSSTVARMARRSRKRLKSACAATVFARRLLRRSCGLMRATWRRGVRANCAL